MIYGMFIETICARECEIAFLEGGVSLSKLFPLFLNLLCNPTSSHFNHPSLLRPLASCPPQTSAVVSKYMNLKWLFTRISAGQQKWMAGGWWSVVWFPLEI